MDRAGLWLTEASFTVFRQRGFSQDLCSYARTNLGLFLEGNERAPGGGMPLPDLLIATQTACTTHVKWWETLSHTLKCPLVVVDAGYPQDGELEDYQKEYFISELKRLVAFIEEHTKPYWAYGYMYQYVPSNNPNRHKGSGGILPQAER
jgi:benzoyl-CoA reductase/2-hydroxyglutaryl-CoA dehydratase subunit BcrC/BadD/HgdB